VTASATTLQEERAGLDAYSRVVAGVAERLLPAVASLRVMAPVDGGRRPVGSGSAVALTPDGFLLTSAHVVARAHGGTAVLTDGRELDFSVVGADPLSDLAVLRVAAGDLPAAELGDAGELVVGQLVVAVGSPLGFAGSVSAGVVSAVGRSFPTRAGRTARLVENVIQTDAALHPGSSGGALADSAGRVVGINTALVGPGAGQGLGLAVPVDTVSRGIIAALVRDGRVRRGYIGVAGGARPLPPRAAAATGRQHGVEVLSVVTDSPADAAGLRPEDLILSLDGQGVAGVADLQRLLTDERIDRPITLEVWRSGDVQLLEARPLELPAD